MISSKRFLTTASILKRPQVVIPTDNGYHQRYRGRPNAGQALPQISQNSQSHLEDWEIEEIERRRGQDQARKGRLEMEHLWDPSSTPLLSPIPSSFSKKKTATMFPGSGSQYPSMGLSLYSKFESFRNIWERGEKALSEWKDWSESLGVGKSLRLDTAAEEFGARKCLRELVLKGPSDCLTISSNAQPAILITSLGFLAVLETDFQTPLTSFTSYFMGHSSGEYSACVAAGVIGFEDGVRLTRLHGLLTHQVLIESKLKAFTDDLARDIERGQMSAFLLREGKTYQELSEVVEKVQKNTGALVEVASYNSSTQVVLSGSKAGILMAAHELEALRIARKAAELPVNAPFHCSFMKPAAEEIKLALEKVEIREPRVPIVSGVNAKPIKTRRDIIDHLVTQIYTPVRWFDCQKLLLSERVERFVFLGPGKALANMSRKEMERGHWKGSEISKNLEIETVATLDDLSRVKGIMLKPKKESEDSTVQTQA